MITAKRLARMLRTLGIPACEPVEPGELEDGMVKVSDAVHVQVGFGYFNAVRQEGTAFRFWPVRKHFTDLLVDLRQAREVPPR